MKLFTVTLIPGARSMFVWLLCEFLSNTSFLVGTRALALSPGASVSDIHGLHIYSLAGLDSPCWSMFAWLVNVAFLRYHQRGSLESTKHILQHRLIFSYWLYSHGLYSTPHTPGGPNLRGQK